MSDDFNLEEPLVVKDNLKRVQSYSSTGLYSECSLRYHFKYNLKLPISTNINLEFGTSIHEALKDFHLAIKKNYIPDLEFLLNKFMEYWTNNILEGDAAKTPEEIEEYGSTGKTLLTLYYNRHINKTKNKWFVPALSVEEAITLPIIDPFTKEILVEDFELIFILDLLQFIGRDLVIIDHKTSKRTFNDIRIKTDMQLTFYYYVILLLIEKGEIKLKKSSKIYVCFNVFYKMKKPWVKEYMTTRTDIDVKRMLSYVQSTIKGIKAGIFTPNHKNQFCPYCDFFEPCQTWNTLESEQKWLNAYLSKIKT